MEIDAQRTYNTMGSNYSYKGDDITKSEKAEGVSKYEDLIKFAGTRGKGNIIIYLGTMIGSFAGAFLAVSYQFLGKTPDYWCYVEPLVNANWTHEEIKAFAIPYNNESSSYDKCQMYGRDYTKAASMGFNKSMITFTNDSIIKCSERYFYKESDSVVTDWDLVCERRYLYSSTQAAKQAGVLIGSFIQGYLLDKFGRRTIILASSLFLIVINFSTAASTNVTTFISMRMISSVFGVGVYLGSFVLAMEICASQQRSFIGNFFAVPWAFGYMVVPLVAYFIRDWQYLQLALSAPCLLFIANFWILPESPRWLILNKKFEEAYKVFLRIATKNGRPLPPKEVMLSHIERIYELNTQKEETTESGGSQAISVVDHCRGAARSIGKFLSHITILVRLRKTRYIAFNVFFGWFAVSLVYYGVSLNATNIEVNEYLYIFLGGLLEVPSYVLLWPASAYFGRRVTLMFLFITCAVNIFSVMGLMLGLSEPPSALMMFLSLTGKFAITAAFELIYVFTAELFPTQYRSLAMGQSSFCARIGSIFSPYINDIIGEVSPWSPSALFGSVSVAAGLLSLLLRDTTHKALSETVLTDYHTEVTEVATEESKSSTTPA